MGFAKEETYKLERREEHDRLKVQMVGSISHFPFPFDKLERSFTI